MFCNINRKRLVLESLFTKITGREFNTGVSCEYCKILKNAYFEEHEQMLLQDLVSLVYNRIPYIA